MNVILVMVQSINGNITRGDDPNIYTWTSKEDADFFFSKLHESKLIVMGSSTYEAARTKIHAKKGQLRIIITRNPDKYSKEKVDGQIEFLNTSPSNLINQMTQKGYDELLLVGGGEVNKLFLENVLVNEIYLTVEPKIFGNGKKVFAAGEYEIDLELVDVKKLNEKGTLLLHYKITSST